MVSRTGFAQPRFFRQGALHVLCLFTVCRWCFCFSALCILELSFCSCYHDAYVAQRPRGVPFQTTCTMVEEHLYYALGHLFLNDEYVE